MAADCVLAASPSSRHSYDQHHQFFRCKYAPRFLGGSDDGKRSIPTIPARSKPTSASRRASGPMMEALGVLHHYCLKYTAPLRSNAQIASARAIHPFPSVCFEDIAANGFLTHFARRWSSMRQASQTFSVMSRKDTTRGRTSGPNRSSEMASSGPCVSVSVLRPYAFARERADFLQEWQFLADRQAPDSAARSMLAFGSELRHALADGRLLHCRPAVVELPSAIYRSRASSEGERWRGDKRATASPQHTSKQRRDRVRAPQPRTAFALRLELNLMGLVSPNSATVSSPGAYRS